MKKFILAFIALFFCMTSYVNAGSKIVFTKTASIIRPKSPQPEVPTLILGEYDDEELVIYLTEYVRQHFNLSVYRPNLSYHLIQSALTFLIFLVLSIIL